MFWQFWQWVAGADDRNAALAGQPDAMRIVHEAVQNGVGLSGVANGLRYRLGCFLRL